LGARELVKAVLPEPVVEWLRQTTADRRDRHDLKRYARHPVTPPPHAVKVQTVIELARRHGIQVLIETGTFEGEMARKCRNAFRVIHTIELSPRYARRAQRRLARWSNIHVVQGDSAQRLPQLLLGLSEPAVFWLDGHYSGGETARGASDTPLLDELEAIQRHERPDHVILIDDARHLGQGAYPSLSTLTQALQAINPLYDIRVTDDMVQAEPPISVRVAATLVTETLPAAAPATAPIATRQAG
jgi:predicted O-methyltransferase YrrM